MICRGGKVWVPEAMVPEILAMYHGSLQRPPPIEIDGEEEYEVEDILDHRRSGRGYQYLVSWTGYDASENQWLPKREL